MRNIFSIIIFLTLFTSNTWGQVDSLLEEGVTLPLVHIVGKTSPKNQLLKTPTPRGLSEIFNQSSLVAIKNYGPGSLSTFSLRGHSSSQTNIILDGFSIQSHTNGTYDLSLIPSFFLQEVNVNGTAGSADINGGIGGALIMKTNNPISQPSQVEIISSYGSFQTLGQYLGGHKQWKNGASSLKMFWRSSENNFKYKNINVIGKPLKKQENGAYRQWGIQQNNHFQLGDKNKLSTKFWYLQNHRQIPPTQLTGNDGSFQDDVLINGIIALETKWNPKWKTHLSSRYSFEKIYYEHPPIPIQALSQAYKWETRAALHYQIHPSHRFSSHLGYELNTADVESYEENHHLQNRFYLQGKYHYQQGNFQAKLSAKEDYAREEFSPFQWGVNLLYKWKWVNSNQLNITLSGSKNYRRPTFNDLYWEESGGAKGNPNLRPEKSYKQEVRIQYKKQQKYQISLLGFNSNVEQWILWYPADDGKWTPENIQKVWSRGLEITGKATVSLPLNMMGNIRGHYRYTQTTNETENDANKGKQLIYVPLHSLDVALELQYQKWYLHFNTVMNDKRFSTTDNSSFVPRYTVGNIMLGKSFSYKKWEFEPTLEIRNIWNEEYHVVANRPMPFRHYQLTIYMKWIE